jgi:hypothetical protein
LGAEFAAAIGLDGWYITQVDQDDQDIQAFWSGTIADSQTTLDSWPAVFVGPPAPDDVQASQDYAEDYQFGSGLDEDWYANVYGFPDQALDVTAPLLALFVPSEPDSTFAAQPHYGEYLWPVQETEDYQPGPEQNEWTAPPAAVVPELLAAQPHFGEYIWLAEETENYANDSTLDTTPSAIIAPPEVLAAQPHFGEDFAAYVPEETTDYQSTEQNEWLAPPEVVVPELLAAQPHWGEVFWPDAETDDYANDSTIDVASFFGIVAGVEPDETHAAQPGWNEHDHDTLTSVETTDYQSTEQNEWLAPPEVVVPELIAAQPHYGDDYATYIPEETTDYQSTEQNEWAAPPEVPFTELMAAQPHFGDNFETYVPVETTDYQQEATLDASYVAPPEVPLTELVAAQPHFGEWGWDAERTEDYSNDSAADAAVFIAPSAAAEPVETFAAQPHYGDDLATYVPVETTDYANDTALELGWSLVPPEVLVPELIAAQPHYGDDFATYVPVETTDYDPSTSVDVSYTAPPVVPLEALIAAQPTFSEHDQFTLTPVETTDYQNDTALEVPHLYPPPPTDAEAQAAQPSFADDFSAYIGAETTDYANDTTLDISYVAPPEVASAELLAAQPHFGEWGWDAEQTTDYENDAALDVSFLAEAPLSDELLQAAQPSFDAQDPSAFIPAETDDYQTQTPLDTPTEWPPGAVVPELIGAQPGFDDSFDVYIAEETTDYANDATLDVSFLVPPEAAVPELLAAQPHYGELVDWPTRLPEEDDGFVYSWFHRPEDAPLEVLIELVQAAIASIFDVAIPPPVEPEDYQSYISETALHPPSGVFATVVGLIALKDPGASETALKDPGVGLIALKDPGVERGAH